LETINTYYEDYMSLQKYVMDNRDVLLASSNRAVLVQVFAGICEKEFLGAISKQIRELIPGAEVIGTTTNGEIMNGLVSGLKTVLSFSVFRHSDIKVAFAEMKDGNDYELGRSIATLLNSDKAKVLILFATGQTVNTSQLLKGVESVNPGLPVAGGSAGDNLTNTQCLILGNEDITGCGVVGVIIESDNLTVACHNHLCWQPIGKEMTITRAEGSRVYTIDNMPAFQVYRRYLGIDDDADIYNVVEFPLSICKHGIEISRSPFLRHDDDSLSFFSDMAEGDKVRFSFGHVEMILEKIDNLLHTIKQQPVESIFVYSCASRRGFLQESTQIETLPLQSIASTAGFFTSGEYFHTDNTNQLLNGTMTTLILSELGGTEEVLMPKEKEAVCSRDMDSNVATIKDNVAARSIEVLTSLTHLINTVTSELNERTIELEAANQALHLSEERFSKAFSCNPDPITITTIAEGRYVEINDAWLEYTGYKRDEAIGHTSSELLRWAVPEDRDPIIKQIRKHGKIRNIEAKFNIKSGEMRTVLLSAEIIDMGGEPHLLFVSKDITDLKRAEADIRYLSYHDKLTGLYNRTFFEEELKRINTNMQLPIGLIIGDVNGLKLINDALGHQEGDKVLIKAAEILRKACRQEDIISRWGGDEFIILLPRCGSAATLRVFKRINDSFIGINSLPIKINISLGMAILTSLDQDIRNVIREAEEKMYRNKLLESRSTRSSFIKSLEKTLWEKSHETKEHCQRLQEMAQKMGRVLELSDSELDNLKLLAALHDIGKIAIPNSILNKPGKLSLEEWETIKNHPEIGYRIALSSPELAPVAEAILHHHESWDGTGYPLGLKGGEIPLISRIIAITDTYDVMINGRPYKKAVSKEEALAEIHRCAGTQFDPELVKKWYS